MTEFEIIDSLPAVYFKEIDTVAVADLHLGLEASMVSKGYYVPEFQLDKVKQELNKCFELTQASRIVLNGDLKNEFSTNYSEKKEVSKLLEFLKRIFDQVVVIKGNHDLFLEETVQGEGLELKESFLKNGVLFVHGHEKIDVSGKYHTVVIGHEHPALALEDDIGHVEKFPCLLHGENDEGLELIVLPAFSHVANGSEVNNMKASSLLSPVLKNKVGLDSMNAIAVSREGGVYDFGRLSKL